MESSSLPLAERLFLAIDTILTLWSERVRTVVAPAAAIAQPILIDTLPAYLEGLAKAVASREDGSKVLDCSGIAQEHGGERARITRYDIDQLILEYQLLRGAIIEVLEEGGRVAPEERTFIASAIDIGIRNAVTAFALVQADIREQFVATLTHDMRNRLAAIAMAAEVILLNPNDPKQVALLAAEIVSGYKRINRMIQDMLDVAVARSEGRLHLAFDQGDLAGILQQVISMLVRVHGPRFTLHGATAKGWWNADALARVFENLGANAVKYGDPYTPITFTISCKFERVIVTVHNEGAPIPIEDQEAIFQVFRRRARQQAWSQGWGIGLALVRGIVESHGGSVAVSSNREHGTSFVVDIPVDARPYRNAPTT